MGEDYNITQTTGKNSGGNNIGVQNNYVGIPPEKAIAITNQLFIDNFPKLQAEAFDIVNKRFSELETKLFSRLAENPFINYSAFADPDIQYIIYKAGESYARFGNEDNLERLCDLIRTRIENNSNDYIKLVVDSAIRVVPKISIEQINYLTVMFYLKRAKLNNVNDIHDLEDAFNRIESLYGPVSGNGFSLLNNLGCFDFSIGNVEDICEKNYSISKEQIKGILPEDFNSVSGDYFTSDIGTVIAITNINQKENTKYELKNFIKY